VTPGGNSRQETHPRVHYNQPKHLHLLNPRLKRLPKPLNALRLRGVFIRPLILAPQRRALIWVVNRTVEVYPLVVVRLAHGDILPQALVAPRAVAVREADRVLAVLGEAEELAAQISEARHFGFGGESREVEVEEAKVSARDVQCVRYCLFLCIC